MGKHSWVTAGGRGASPSKKLGKEEVGTPWGHSLVAVTKVRGTSAVILNWPPNSSFRTLPSYPQIQY